MEKVLEIMFSGFWPFVGMYLLILCGLAFTKSMFKLVCVIFRGWPQKKGSLLQGLKEEMESEINN